MKKRIIFICSVLLISGVAFGLYFFLRSRHIPGARVTLVPTPTESPKMELATWTDPAGFTFQYYAETAVDTHTEDGENYAHLEFKSATHSGSLLVWAKDTDAEDVSSWVNTDRALKDAPNLDTTLGGLPAKKIVLSGPVKNRIVGAVTDGILFTVESTSSADPYWQNMYDTVVRTFVFTDQSGNKINTTRDDGSGTGESSEVQADEEETIE